MNTEIVLITIGGKDYITPSQMGAITNKTTMQIYNLINNGNCIRKMKAEKIGSQWLIPYTEIVDYPFTKVGRNAETTIYHYDYNGTIIEEEKIDGK